MGDADVMLAAGGVSKSRRFAGRRSPTTGHRRRLRSPDSSEQEHAVAVGRHLSIPGDVLTGRPSESSEGESVLPSSGKEVTRLSTDSGTSDSEVPPKPVLRKRTKTRGHKSDEGEREKDEKESWWRTMASWAQRGKSLEREVGAGLKVVTRRRHRSLTGPSPEMGETPPVVKMRGKVKPREPERRISVEDSSDDFWKPAEVVEARAAEGAPAEKSEISNERIPKEERKKHIGRSKSVEEQVTKREKSTEKASSHELEEEVKRAWWKLSTQSKNEKRDDREPLIADKPTAKEAERTSWVKLVLESKSLWTSFRAEHAKDVATLKRLRNRCIASLLILVIYCGLGGLMFRIVEGAFESFYKCGVKRVKRDFVDGLWTGSHHLREDEWKSLARRHLMQFEEQLHAAYEAGMTSYSGQRAWTFLNAVSYCLTVVTTIGYGHISPSTTTGRALTIAYAIFGIPMFLILLADFGKLFTRGMKFGWAFVRRLYYTGSCRTVRRTAPVQEVMKGVQLVYDMAMFRRPSELPPGVEGLPLGVDGAPPLPPRPPYSPTEPPSTPALSNFAIDDEFNLPISVAIVVLLGYIFCGATVFYWWETWGFFESFYFVFISMSTIGFGDFVPQNHMYMMASIVYLVFGLALTSMCINVVQEKLSDSFRQASAKIGATIGLRMAEEEGATIMPPGVAPVEMPEVHLAARHQAPSAT